MKYWIVCVVLCLASILNAADEIPVKEIQDAMRKACDYQLAEQAKKKADNGWVRGAFYTGVTAAYHATQDEHYLDAAMKWAKEQGNFTPSGNQRDANNQCCGQTYLDLYLLKRDPAMVAPIRAAVDQMIAKPRPGRVDWWWCDSMFMAPPTIARLGTVTGDANYFDFLDQMFWDSSAFLFDPEANLYFRDKSFFNARTKNGQKVFWSRGNGWVFGGLCRTIDFIPPERATYSRYVERFQAMAAALAKLQGADGLWRSSLLDAAEFPMPETSGTGFYCYGFAWGLNNSKLDQATYLPIARKAWRGLVGKLTAEGKLGYVQKVAGAPGAVKAEDTHEYAVGAFLLAGSELMQLENRLKQIEDTKSK